MSLTSYRTAPPRVMFSTEPGSAGVLDAVSRRTGGSSGVFVFFLRAVRGFFLRAAVFRHGEEDGGVSGGPGDGLLSHVSSRSTIGAEGFHGRVRNGIGWGTLAPVTGSSRHSAPRGSRRLRGGGWVFLLRGSGDLAARGEFVRAIRTGKLHALPRFHIRPIDVVVFHGSDGETWFRGGFPA